MVSESGQMVWLQLVCSETKLQADGSEKPERELKFCCGLQMYFYSVQKLRADGSETTERKLWFYCGWQMCSCSVTKLHAVGSVKIGLIQKTCYVLLSSCRSARMIWKQSAEKMNEQDLNGYWTEHQPGEL